MRWLGLTLALASALLVNLAYNEEHDAAADLPRLTPRKPLRSIKLLLHDRAWRKGFATESTGWLLYVGAMRLAPLALVQAVGAGGIGVLALLTARGDPRRLRVRQRFAVLAALVGLVCLALSLLGAEQSDRTPRPLLVALWLAGCAVAAAVLVFARLPFARTPSLGLAAGLLFAGGDISVKLVVHSGLWFVAVVSLVAFYALGTMRLQAAFQQGDALTAAGMATLATNAVPIAAGFALFGESLPGGARAVLQLVGFAAVVISAVALGNPRG
ncbi:MAG: hypothetical protein ACRDLM_10985 [Gaiellaceae bacterium]